MWGHSPNLCFAQSAKNGARTTGSLNNVNISIRLASIHITLANELICSLRNVGYIFSTLSYLRPVKHALFFSGLSNWSHLAWLAYLLSSKVSLGIADRFILSSFLPCSWIPLFLDFGTKNYRTSFTTSFSASHPMFNCTLVTHVALSNSSTLCHET
jgi:hypothetical protein